MYSRWCFFIDKETLIEPIPGKDCNEIYKSFLLVQDEERNRKRRIEKTNIKKTLQRKQLLKIYMNKFLIRENMMILRQKNHEQPEDRINMDKFLEKIKG